MLIDTPKKRTYHPVDFAVPADHRVKMKVIKRLNKYLDLARELKKLWNMKVTMISIVIGVLRDLRRFAVSETLVKKHQLELMWKTCKE